MAERDAELAQTAAIVLFLQRAGAVHLTLLGATFPRMPGGLKRFLERRPETFVLQVSQVRKTAVWTVGLIALTKPPLRGVPLQHVLSAPLPHLPPQQARPGRGNAAPPPPPRAPAGDACLACGAAASPTHNVYSCLLVRPRGGVTLTGPSELRSSVAPASGRVSCRLVISNVGSDACLLLGVRLLRPTGDARAYLDPGHDADAPLSLLPGHPLSVVVEHDPAQAGARLMVVVCALASHARAASFAVGHELTLRCTDASSDADVALLAPTSAYVRPRPVRGAGGGGPPREVVAGEPLPAPPIRMPRLADVPVPQLFRDAAAGGADAVAACGVMLAATAPLRAATHAARFRDLLLLEEAQQLVDIRMYDMVGALLRRGARPGELLLDVPGLAESRPSVMRGDSVRVSTPGDGPVFEGVVHGVALETVALRFSHRFHHIVGQRYFVRFSVRRTSALLQHAAVASAGATLPLGLLFPPPLLQLYGSEDAARAAAAAVAASRLLHPLHNRGLNARQRLAVKGALFRSGGSSATPFLLFGPPGTGKTSTAAEYVLQAVASSRRPTGAAASAAAALFSRLRVSSPHPSVLPQTLVLVSAPSNAAVDELASRLVAPRGPLQPSELVRANAFARPRADVAPSLAACCLYDAESDGFILPTADQLSSGRGVVVVAATVSTAQRIAQMGGISFSHVVIDEAGHVSEPECLCAVARLLRPPEAGGARLLLAGDPQQLGPVLGSALAAESGLGTSLLERLMDATASIVGESEGPHAQRAVAPADRVAGGDEAEDTTLPPSGRPGGFHPAFCVQLTHNYRSHPALLEVPNVLFYGGTLVPCADAALTSPFCRWEGLTAAARATPGGFPLLFHGVEGEDTREGNSPSWFNAVEAAAVLSHVRSILDCPGTGARPSDVGVITPYHKQAQKLRQLLEKHGLRDVRVGFVEVFQGGERSAVVVSCVRSSVKHVPFDARHALGFLANPKRFNVRSPTLSVIRCSFTERCVVRRWR